MKDQKLTNLNRELQEITYGGSTEEEVAKLRKTKHELENKISEQVIMLEVIGMRFIPLTAMNVHSNWQLFIFFARRLSMFALKLSTFAV